jgi:hypothetical protein
MKNLLISLINVLVPRRRYPWFFLKRTADTPEGRINESKPYKKSRATYDKAGIIGK